MGASRKLQGEIDRVLKKVQEGVDVFDSIWNKVYDSDNINQKEKFEADLKKEIKKLQRYRDQIKTWLQSSEIKDKKVSASYEQALLDARKLIEREMERFKICEKETKTKAFSKEGLVQQPKTDPKEKAKSETRDWLNNVVGELELQIDTFEAEMEGLSVKKGKTRPPRLIHLETSIARHKAHIMKLELILRLLDNEELSPEQINDVKDFLEDYVERNQEDFDEFSDVDELYNTLPLDKVESLEELVTIVAPSLVKGSAATSSVISLKPSLAPSSPTPQSASVQEPTEEAASQDTNSDSGPRTPPAKPNAVNSSAFSIPPGVHATSVALNVSAHVSGASSAPSAIPASIPARSIVDTVSAAVSSQLSISVPAIEEESVNVPDRRPSPVLADVGLNGIGRTSPVASVPPSPGAVPSSNMTLTAVPLASEVAKRNILGADERLASSVVAGRASPSSPGVQWRPGTPFQNQTEVFRGRPEIAPDHREKFLQRFQQVQQQGHSNVLGGMPALGSGNQKQFPGQQPNSILPQLNSQSSPLTLQAGIGLGIQSSGVNTSMPMSLQQSTPLHQQAVQQGSVTIGPRDTDVSYTTAEQQQQNLSDPAAEVIPNSSLVKNLMNDDELKSSYAKDVLMRDSPSPLMESMQLQRDTDLSPGLLLHPSQPSPSAGLGVIGRRSVANLGTIGDSVTPNPEGMHDQMYCLQMLEAAFHKLPQPKDSERAKSYIPRNPAATPSSFPQVQAPIVNNPAFWERLGMDPSGTDALFFAFYFQQNTYQQYLAARELKKQSWRYHRMWNMWFQRHEEPKIATDEYEKGTYIYFDYNVKNDDLHHGWCQRLKHDFEFVYNYLEDELIV
ncbi:CCR4-NOT transcription complex subunit 3-like protein [Drosera capensis]